MRRQRKTIVDAVLHSNSSSPNATRIDARRNGERLWPWTAALAVILAVAAALRLYHLEVPSMWWDEILVPLTARFPVPYILDFSRHCEMHPPLYHLLVKVMEWCGVSDYALRVPSAACGIVAIYVCWKLFSKLYGRPAALAAAAFLAGSAMQVWHVRQVRPYAIMTLLFIFSLYYLLSFLRYRRNSHLCALIAVNAPLFLLHYFTFPIVLAQGVALAVNWRRSGEGVSTRQLFVFGLGTAVVALPVLAFFFFPSQTTLSIFAFKASYLDVWRLILEYSAQVLWSHDDDVAMRLAIAAVLLAGAAAMARRTPKELAACVLLAVIPALILLAMRKTAYFSPRHFLYLTIPAALLAGQATHYLPRPWLAIPASLLLAIAPAGLLAALHADAYYAETSYHHPVFITDYKPMAKELAQRLHPGEVVAATETGTVNAVSWYLDQFVAENPFERQSRQAGEGDFALRIFAPYKTWGHLGKTESAFLEAVGPVAAAEPVLNAMLYTVPIHKEPVPIIGAIPYNLRRRAELPGFYRQVSAFSNMTVTAYWGGEAIATQNSTPAWLEYRFHNAAGNAPQLLQFQFEYKNQGEGSTMVFSLVFDNGPPQPIAVSAGPDASESRTVTIRRDAPYKEMALRVQTVCAPLTARYPGGNLETSAFRGFDLEIIPTGVFDSASGPAVTPMHFGKIEHNDANIWRWGLGPQSQLTFDLAEAASVWLEFDFANVIAGQTVTVMANGEVLKVLPDLPADARESLRIPIAGHPGRNTVTIGYSDWNHGRTTFSEGDIRPMALFIRKLRVVPYVAQ